jgi:hypothetical protein
MPNIVLDLSLFVLGNLIGALVQWLFSRQSSKELREEAAQLRRLNEMVLRVMEKEGWIELQRNEEGEITGLNFKQEVGGTLSLSGHLTTVVKRANASADDVGNFPDD